MLKEVTSRKLFCIACSGLMLFRDVMGLFGMQPKPTRSHVGGNMPETPATLAWPLYARRGRYTGSTKAAVAWESCTPVATFGSCSASVLHSTLSVSFFAHLHRVQFSWQEKPRLVACMSNACRFSCFKRQAPPRALLCIEVTLRKLHSIFTKSASQTS